MPARSGVILLALAVLAAPAAAQTTPPPLPRLALDAYPPKTREAISPVYEAAVRRPTDAAAVGSLGRILHAWEQWDVAHQAYLRAQALAPRALEWPYLDAIVLQRLARDAEAADQFRRALGASPGYLPARVKLAEVLVKSGEFDESKRLFEALVRDPMAEPLAQFGLGQIAAAEGHHEAAIPHLLRALTLFPEWGEAHYALALSYRALGRRDEAVRAIESLERFGAIAPGLEDPVLATTSTIRDDAVANLQRGMKLAAAGDLAGAIAIHEAAVAQDPSFAQAHANLMRLYGPVGNWAKLTEHYQALVKLGVDLGEANFNYGVALGLQGKEELAEGAYRRAIEINPQHTDAHINLGILLEGRHQLEAAAAEFRLAVDSQPTYRPARYQWARRLLAQDRAPEAIAEFEKMTEPRDPEALPYLLGLAVAHARAGHGSESARWEAEVRRLAISLGKADFLKTIDETLSSVRKGQP